jgi:hypothetical protein
MTGSSKDIQCAFSLATSFLFHFPSEFCTKKQKLSLGYLLNRLAGGQLSMSRITSTPAMQSLVHG